MKTKAITFISAVYGGTVMSDSGLVVTAVSFALTSFSAWDDFYLIRSGAINI